VPRFLTAALAGQAVVLLGLLIAGVTMSSPDAAGRSGRALSVTCPADSQLLSPWPGPYYAWPILGGLGLGTVACALLLRRVTARSWSDDHRRMSARAAVGAWGVLVSAPLFAVSLTIGVVVLSLTCAGGWRNVAVCGLAVTAVIAVMTACHCLNVLLLPQVYLKDRP
jgi:hypothetical protein